MKYDSSTNRQLLGLAYRLLDSFSSNLIVEMENEQAAQAGFELERFLLTLLPAFPDDEILLGAADDLLLHLRNRFDKRCRIKPDDAPVLRCGIRISRLYLQLAKLTFDDAYIDAALEVSEWCMKRFNAERILLHLPISEVANAICALMQLHVASGEARLLPAIDQLLKVAVHNVKAQATHFQFNSMPEGQLGLNGLSNVPPVLALTFAHVALYLDNGAYFSLSRSIYPAEFQALPNDNLEAEALYRLVCTRIYETYAQSIVKHYPKLPETMLFEQIEWLTATFHISGKAEYLAFAKKLVAKYINKAHDNDVFALAQSGYLRLLLRSDLPPISHPNFAGFEAAMVTDAERFPYITIFEEELKNRFISQIYPETVKCMNGVSPDFLIDF